MAFYPPRFNVWAGVYRYNTLTDVWDLVGYSICQVRGTTSHESSDVFAASNCQVLFPAGSDVRSTAISDSHVADMVMIAGYERFRLRVSGICDKGAGFGNEYREANCLFDELTSGEDPRAALLRVNPELLPPIGAPPLPVNDPGTTWHPPF